MLGLDLMHLQQSPSLVWWEPRGKAVLVSHCLREADPQQAALLLLHCSFTFICSFFSHADGNCQM